MVVINTGTKRLCSNHLREGRADKMYEYIQKYLLLIKKDEEEKMDVRKQLLTLKEQLQTLMFTGSKRL